MDFSCTDFENNRRNVFFSKFCSPMVIYVTCKSTDTGFCPYLLFIYIYRKVNYFCVLSVCSRYQSPRGLTGESAAPRLLGLRVRTPPGTWISLSFKCCVFQVEVSVTDRSLFQSSPTECVVSVISKPRPGGSLGPRGLSSRGRKKKSYLSSVVL